MFEEQHPPPGYEPPELKAQLKSSTLVVVLIAALINLLGGHQLWRAYRTERVGRDVTLTLGIAALVFINVVCIALIGYAQWGKE